MNNTMLITGIVAVALVAIFVIGGSSESALGYEGHLYKSSSCGCCGVYAAHMDKDMNIRITDVIDINEIKVANDIPTHLYSCHTTIMDGYYIEGHIPQEAIVKLMEERPDIAGIALPGMPSGTPGMPGPKRGDWVIHAVHHDGSTSEFMRI